MNGTSKGPLARIRCVCGDITREEVDAIVNAANSSLQGGGGVDGAIHRAAGRGLVEECMERYPRGCPTGEARLTTGHALPARRVIHTVGPVWSGGGQGEPELLASCYRRSLALAAEEECRSVSFPAISCGVYGYPLEAAAEVAIGALGSSLAELPGIEQVRMVLFDGATLAIFEHALSRARQEAGE